MRIVSLLPSATEMIVGLGLREKLVARSHECDFPPDVLTLPACTAREIELTESTPGIQFRATRAPYRALSVFTIDWDLLRGLRPTHIVTQTLCRHCAVSQEDVKQVLRDEMFTPPDVFSLEARSLSGVFEEIRELASWLGEHEAGVVFTRALEDRIEQIAARACARSTVPPTVACLEWLQPVMMGGHWMPELIRKAGGIPAGGGDGDSSPWMNWEAFYQLDPDLIIAMPCGYRLNRIGIEMHWLTEHSGWNSLKAVKNGQVFLADGSFFFNRPGPRLVESLQVLAEIISPETCGTRMEGIAWKRYSGSEQTLEKTTV